MPVKTKACQASLKQSLLDRVQSQYLNCMRFCIISLHKQETLLHDNHEGYQNKESPRSCLGTAAAAASNAASMRSIQEILTLQSVAWM